MHSVTLSAPAMYADHHVLKVREALLAQSGVEEVMASSAWQAVIVSYDPDKTDPASIQQTLTQAGYPPDKTTPILAQSGEQFKDPAWAEIDARVRKTNESDLRLSGDFRRY
jgi:copper chaperone CopZ